MNFRVTSFASSNQALKYSSQYSAKILKFQEQISSGIRLHRPSDDPISFRQASSYSIRLQELQTQSYSIVDSETKLNTSVSQLQAAHDLIVRAKTLAQQGIQTASQSEQTALAVEIDGLLVSLQEITKTQSAGSYLYSGARTNQVPFDFGNPAVDGGTLNVRYLGSSENSRAYIGDAISVDTFFAGDGIFGDPHRDDTLIYGSSGTKIGTGTDNMVGRATLQVRHTATTFFGSSGVVAGASSAEFDTLLGPAGRNQLVVQDRSGTGNSGTITLNGGPPILWSSSDTDLRVPGNNGEEIFVDMSAITPGFIGTVDFESNGTLSIDGGLTTTAIDFSASQTVLDSTTGKQTHLDTRELRKVGNDFLEFPGTSDAFQVLYELTLDLRNTRGLDNVQRAAALDRRVGELDHLADHVLEVMGRQSASLKTLNELDFRVQDLQLEVETQLNNLQATDISEAVLRLQNDQSLLQYTYAVTSQIASTSLIDFLR
jgi:flagellin-like hook-associated protein FlgL